MHQHNQHVWLLLVGSMWSACTVLALDAVMACQAFASTPLQQAHALMVPPCKPVITSGAVLLHAILAQLWIYYLSTMNCTLVGCSAGRTHGRWPLFPAHGSLVST